MAKESVILNKLEKYILENHESGDIFSKWCIDYDYITLDFEGPYINEDTDEPDESCVMYLINIDNHLSKRLKSPDKTSLPQNYDSLYGWIFIDSGLVDIVGMDNYEDDQKLNLLNNLEAFFKYIKSVS